MWLPFAGLVLGILIGQALIVPIPVQYASYLGVAVLAALDSVFGGFRTMLANKFDSTVMMSGFFVNSLLAALLTYMGDQLGINLHYVAIFVFGVRLFDNMAVIRRTLMDKYFTTHHDKSS